MSFGRNYRSEFPGFVSIELDDPSSVSITDRSHNFGLAAYVSSTGQQFLADSCTFAASFLRIRKGIASSCPNVKVTYSNCPYRKLDLGKKGEAK